MRIDSERKSDEVSQEINSNHGGYLSIIPDFWGSPRIPSSESKDALPLLLSFLKNNDDHSISHKISAVLVEKSNEICFLFSKPNTHPTLYRFNYLNQTLLESTLMPEENLKPTGVCALSEDRIAVDYDNDIKIYTINGQCLRTLHFPFKKTIAEAIAFFLGKTSCVSAMAFLGQDKLIIVGFEIIKIYEISTGLSICTFDDVSAVEFPSSCDIRINVSENNIIIAYFKRVWDMPANATYVIKNWDSLPKLHFMPGVFLCETKDHLVQEVSRLQNMVDSVGDRADPILYYDICLFDKKTLKRTAKARRERTERSAAVCLPNGCIKVENSSEQILYSPKLELIGIKYDKTSEFVIDSLLHDPLSSGRSLNNAPFIFYRNEGAISGNLMAFYRHRQILEDSLPTFSLDLIRLIKEYYELPKHTFASVPKEILVQFGNLLITHLDDVTHFPINCTLAGCCVFTAPKLAAKRRLETQLKALLTEQETMAPLKFEEAMTSRINDFWKAIYKSNKNYRDSLATFLNLDILGPTKLEAIRNLKTFTITHLRILVANMVDNNILSKEQHALSNM